MDSDSGVDAVKQVAEQLWLSVLSDFDNAAAHNSFIQYCAATKQLPLAGQKYKSYREQKGDSPLIDNCMKKIVVHAQAHCLAENDKDRAAKRGPLPRFLASLLFLIAGFILVVLWISYPSSRNGFLVLVAIVAGVLLYRSRRNG